MKKISLIQMKEKQKAKILEISGSANLQNKLMNLGLCPGREITKLSHMALRGPVTIKVYRSVLALGHSMAEKVIVEVE
ncbi:MAG TPA: FeoA family protein [Candidatus Margulisiibacteriota bacterium]|nr:FeoA family protein [Candidatus Margulisiibacteriota bacterium]